MYTGKLVKLREYRKEDAKLAQKLINNPSIKKNLTTSIPFPICEWEEEKWVQSNSAFSSSKYSFAIETLDDNKYIGGCGINTINWLSRTAEIGIFIGNTDYHSKGYGSDALKVLINFIFNQMNIRKIKLNVYSFNERAIGCYKKLGFQNEGTLRDELFRDGKYYNIVMMGMFKEEFIQ